MLRNRGRDVYIKPAHPTLAAFKISLHGGRAELAPINFAYIDRGSRRTVEEAGGAFLQATGEWAASKRPVLIGQKIYGGALHLVRLRWTWDLFLPGREPAPQPRVRSGELACQIRLPARMRAVDVDLYVAPRRPYFPNRRRAEASDAVLGQFKYDGGYLTAISNHHHLAAIPTPQGLRPVPTAVGEDVVRGIGAGKDESEVLWICEQWMPRKQFEGDREEWVRPPAA
jgi:hypothetical protein